MIFISRENLCVITTETVLDTFSKKELTGPLLERPGNVIYFEAEGKLYGLVSSGDIHRSEGETVRINKQYTSFHRDEPMLARKFFFSHPRINEIPAVIDGQLVGEYQAADDELYLDTAIPMSRNAYARGYFAELKRFALVLPTPAHRYKQKFFDRMKSALDDFQADYTIMTLEEMMERFDDYEQFLMVDTPEKKGALLALYLLRGTKYYQRIITYEYLIQKLESAAVMDYEGAFRELQSLGLEMILLTAGNKNSEYKDRTIRAIRERFPTAFPDDLNSQVMKYAETFFDDLCHLDGYVDNILNGYFLVEQQNQHMQLRNTQSRYINVSAGCRVTVEQPKEYDRTIYFFGPCLVIGSYEGDEYTIESYLQKIINAAGKKIRVVNCGCWGGRMTTLSRMVSTRFKKGDMIVCIPEVDVFNFEGFNTLDLWDILEEHNIPAEWMLDHPYHVNHHVTKLIAEKLYSELFRNGEAAIEGLGESIPYHYDLIDKFYIKKYFYNVDLSKYNTAACLVFNGNPFTNGHRYLVETAARETEHVYLLVLQAEASLFTFMERYAMAVEALKDLPNVTVVPSGLFIGYVAAFPGYYAKMFTPDTIVQAREHAISYARVAQSLHATHRFLGEEPTDPITLEVNRACLEILPEYGIKTVILPRKENGDAPLTGSYVREIAEKDPDRLAECVASSTADIILCRTINSF